MPFWFRRGAGRVVDDVVVLEPSESEPLLQAATTVASTTTAITPWNVPSRLMADQRNGAPDGNGAVVRTRFQEATPSMPMNATGNGPSA